MSVTVTTFRAYPAAGVAIICTSSPAFAEVLLVLMLPFWIEAAVLIL